MMRCSGYAGVSAWPDHRVEVEAREARLALRVGDGDDGEQGA